MIVTSHSPQITLVNRQAAGHKLRAAQPPSGLSNIKTDIPETVQ